MKWTGKKYTDFLESNKKEYVYKMKVLQKERNKES